MAQNRGAARWLPDTRQPDNPLTNGLFRSIRGDDPKQRGYGHILAVFGYQAFGIKPAATVAAIATDFQPGKVRGDLTEGDNAAGHPGLLRAGVRAAVGFYAATAYAMTRLTVAGCQPPRPPGVGMPRAVIASATACKVVAPAF